MWNDIKKLAELKDKTKWYKIHPQLEEMNDVDVDLYVLSYWQICTIK